MSNTLILNQPYVNVGISNTQTITLATAGLYRCQVQSTDIPPSGLIITVNQNGSPIYTTSALGSVQIAQQFKVSFLAAAADVITVVLSSSSAIDSQLNSVKTTIAVMQGA